jgi:hypothetical protein
MNMLEIKLEQKTRRCRCHVPGCRNRNALKISRRHDVNGNPLFLCPDCIREIADAYGKIAEGAAVEEIPAAETPADAKRPARKRSGGGE